MVGVGDEWSGLKGHGCYVSQQTYAWVEGSLTLREVLMKRCCILKIMSKVRTRDKGTRSQLVELWICKTDTMIV